jgi:polygalacturonase
MRLVQTLVVLVGCLFPLGLGSAVVACAGSPAGGNGGAPNPGAGGSADGTGGSGMIGGDGGAAGSSGSGGSASGSGGVGAAGSSEGPASSGGPSASGSGSSNGGGPSQSGADAGSAADSSGGTGTNPSGAGSADASGPSIVGAGAEASADSASFHDSSSGASSGGAADAAVVTGVGAGCGAGDPNLAGVEPQWPAVCTQISAQGMDIQAALTGCAGKGAVKLTGSGASYTSGALSIPAGAFLWVDTGVTLFPTATGSRATIEAGGDGSGIVGHGTIDGSQSPSGSVMIHAAVNNFVMYEVNLKNSQKMHVKVQGDHFVIWGITIITPPTTANTDGIDPGAGESGVATSNGYIVCNTISTGDDQIAIKGAEGLVSNLTIAHNYFGAGHGMSIGSETGPGGINGVHVYDLTIDGDVYPGASAVNANAIRVKSYNGAGGVVDNVVYENICARNLHNAILFEPNYSSGTSTGGGAPDFRNFTIRDFHQLRGSGSQSPLVTVDGTGSTAVTLDDVVIDGAASFAPNAATVTVGAGGAAPGPSGASQDSPVAIDCSQRFIAFPVQY